jgi:hypothetical protein
MSQTFEAIVDENGNVRLLAPLHLPKAKRAIVTLIEDTTGIVAETALMSEATLANDWMTVEEDEAWSHLLPAES